MSKDETTTVVSPNTFLHLAYAVMELDEQRIKIEEAIVAEGAISPASAIVNRLRFISSRLTHLIESYQDLLRSLLEEASEARSRERTAEPRDGATPS